MTSLTLAALLHASVLTVGADSYADAHRATVESGRPMLVMVSAEWCGSCKEMERNVLPEVKKHGLLQKVNFAVVNVDRERTLAQKLIGGSGPVPQLVMFRRNGDGWLRKKLVGNQSPEAVEKFIEQGIELDQIAKEATSDETSPTAETSSTASEEAEAKVAEKPAAESAARQ